MEKNFFNILTGAWICTIVWERKQFLENDVKKEDKRVATVSTIFHRVFNYAARCISNRLETRSQCVGRDNASRHYVVCTRFTGQQFPIASVSRLANEDGGGS